MSDCSLFGTSDAAVGAGPSSSPYPPQCKKQTQIGPCLEDGHQDGRVLEYVMHKETLKRPEFVQPEAEEAKRRTELIAVLSCLMGHYSQMEPDC